MLPRKTSPSAFSLMEVLIVIAVLAVLTALIIPITARIRDRAAEVNSFNNLRQIGSALSLYASENGGYLPLLTEDYSRKFWTLSLTPYLETAKVDPDTILNRQNSEISRVFFDPAVSDGDHHNLGDYGANSLVFSISRPERDEPMEPMSISTLDDPGKLAMVMAAEKEYNGRPIGSWYINSSYYIAVGNNSATPCPSDRGQGSIHTLFGDGHVSAIPTEEFLDNRRELLRP